MSQVAAMLQDFDVMVFRHTVAGTTYDCAVRWDLNGWRLISYLADSAVNAAVVIQAGMNGLSAGRTSFETCVVMGSYTLGERLNVPDYTEFDISMASFTIPNNATPTFVVYLGQNIRCMIYVAVSNVRIIGGWLDGNGDNQGANQNWALVYVLNASDVRLFGVHAEDSLYGVNAGANWRAFCYLVSESSYVELDSCTGNHSGYEVVGLRNNNHFVIVVSCRFYDGVVHVLQCTDVWWGNITASTFIDIGDNHLGQTISAGHIFTCHSTSNIFFHDNKLNAPNPLSICCIKIIGDSVNIWLESNTLRWSPGNVATAEGIRIGDAGAGVAGTVTDIHILYNEIIQANVVNASYGIHLHGAACVQSDIDIIGNKVSAQCGLGIEDIVPTRICVMANRFVSYAALIRSINVLSGLTYSTINYNKCIAGGAGAVLYLNAVTYCEIDGNYCSVGSFGVYEIGASDYNVITNNNVAAIATAAQRLNLVGVHTISSGNIGYNPRGFAATTPAVAATNVDVQNIYGFTVRIYILTIGTVTAYRITDPAGGLQAMTTVLFAGMEITLDPGAMIRFTYTGAPTWKWYGT